jgi:hypothetical protein
MENTLVKTIEVIADRLTDPDVSVAAFAQKLGEIKEKYTGSGYYLTPLDTRFETIWVGIRAEKQSEDLTDVELSLHPSVQLLVVDLDRAFGRHKTVPVNPDGRRYRIGYRFDKAGKPYTAALYATLSGPDAADTRVVKISIRRDRR